jgi:hypothetical protein
MKAHVAVLLGIAACGGGQEAKTPQPDQTTQTDASVPNAASDAAPTSSATSTQTDAAVAQTTPTPPADDVDKSVSVCGDEAVPLEKKIRKGVKACWSTAASKNPNLDGHVRVSFVVDPKGKVTKTEIAQAKALGAETTACMTQAINANKLDGTKCAGKSVAMEMAFGRAAQD